MRTTRALFVAAGLWILLVGPALGQSIRVVTPNDGSPVTLGAPLDILWTSSGVTQPLRILLFRNGERLGAVASDVPVASGSYRWIAGNYGGGTAPEGEGYSISIRVQGVDLEDSSDRTFALRAAADFTIPGRVYTEPASFRVDAPRAGERLAVGNRVEIRWTSPAPSDSGCGNTVRISAVRQGDGRETTLAGYRNNYAGANTYSWYILPPVFEDLLGDYRIRISGGTNCMAESEVFTLAKGSQLLTDEVEINQPAREEGPDPIDAAIAIRTDSFRMEKGTTREAMDASNSNFAPFRIRQTIQARIANRWPSGAPIEIRRTLCRWHLEEHLSGGAWAAPRRIPDGRKNGTFEVGPVTSGPGVGRGIEILIWLPKNPANEWAGEMRYRLRIEIDPDRTLPDPDRDNNTCYSPSFPNPRSD